jgi:hypothetical protein
VEVVKETKSTHFIFINFFENRADYDTMSEKFGEARGATDNNRALACCMLGN